MKLHFRKSGTGRPLIIIHGLFGMSDNWITLSKQFAGSGFLVYAIDVRNHGRSPHSEEFNYASMADDLAELMNDEGISEAAILGHSMGGKAGMWFASLHPDRVSKLISCDISPRYYAPHHQSVFAAIHAVDLQRIKSRKEAETNLRELLHDEDTIQFLLKNLFWNEREKLEWRFYLQGIENNIAGIGEALPSGFRFEGAVLFIRGEKSGYIVESDTSEIIAHFPQAVIKTVSGAGHWVHAENPKGFIETVLEFLN